MQPLVSVCPLTELPAVAWPERRAACYVDPFDGHSLQHRGGRMTHLVGSKVSADQWPDHERPHVRGDIAMASRSTQTVLLDLRTERYYQLNPVAARVWALLCE